MTIYAFHTTNIPSQVISNRSGTYRVNSDNPSNIIVYRGWDSIINFAFRDHMQRPYSLNGRSARAIFFNHENVEILNLPLQADQLIDGAASLVMSSQTTNILQSGLYSLIIEINDEGGRKLVAQASTRNLPRFVVEVIDQKTVSLNE